VFVFDAAGEFVIKLVGTTGMAHYNCQKEKQEGNYR